MSILVELPESEYDVTAFAAFDPGAGFSLASARSMAWMAQLAYETRWPDKVDRIGRLWGLRDVRCLLQPAHSTLPMSSTKGVLAAKDDVTILAFAGTDPLNLLNWITDFSLGRPGADLHEGFVAAAAAVWDEVGATIERSIAAGHRLFVAGHSLGAALALVTIDRAAQEKGLARSETYLFGCPRVGRAAFASRYNLEFGSSTYRFMHGADIVATVPPPELDFRHVGCFLACGRGERFDATRLMRDLDADLPTSGDDLISGIVWRLISLVSGPLSQSSRADVLGQISQVLAPGIADHLPDRYCTALRRCG